MSTLIKFPKHFISPMRSVRSWVIPLLLLALWQYSSSQNAGHAYAFVPLQNVYNAFIELLKTGE